MGHIPDPILSGMSAVALAVLWVFVSSSSDVGIAHAFSENYAFCSAPSALSTLRPSSGCKVSKGARKLAEADSLVKLYLFPTPSSVLAANQPQKHQFLLPPSSSGSNDPKHNRGPEMRLPMGSAVLAECDTLPAFRAAHGLLSPEVVSRIADTHELELGAPLHKFLRTYRHQGPMACVPLLSDPCVLPALTQAMREVA